MPQTHTSDSPANAPVFPRHSLLSVGLLAVLSAAAAEHPAKAPVPPSPYLGVVYRYADALLNHARDQEGPAKTGLFLGALDRATLEPLTHLPAPPAGIAAHQRSGIHGANPQHDENLLRLLYVLKGLSGESKYDQAADQELKWFLENTPSPVTGLLPWGESLRWNTLTDQPAPGENGVHELFRPWLLWDRCFELAPRPSARYALALWTRHVLHPDTGELHAQAAFDLDKPPKGEESPRHAGFLIRTWANAHAHTGDPHFLDAIDAVLRRQETLPSISPNAPGHTSDPAERLSLAIDCDGAARLLPAPLARRLIEFSRREDNRFLQLNHSLDESSGFAAATDSAGSRSPHTPLWRPVPGRPTTARMALLCSARYDNTGDARYRDLILQAARAYLASDPPAEEDVWAGTLGHAISLQIAAWRSAAEPVYLDRARHFGDLALKEFWGDRPLPKASRHSGHYESITGTDTLALALTEMHLEILAITAVRCPANTIDR